MKSIHKEERDEAAESRAIIDALRRLVRGLRLYARHCETRLGLSAAQLFALRKVQEAGTLMLQGLARATLTDLSSVSVVAERLRAKGLLHSRRASRLRSALRARQDARVIVIDLPWFIKDKPGE